MSIREAVGAGRENTRSSCRVRTPPRNLSQISRGRFLSAHITSVVTVAVTLGRRQCCRVRVVTEGTRKQGRGLDRISLRTAAWLAGSLWALSITLTGLSLVLLALNLSHPGTHIFDWWLGNATIVIDMTVGAIVVSRRPENPVGWLLCLSGVAVSTSSFTSQYAIYTLLARAGSLPAGEASAWVAAWMLPIMIGLQVSYILLFPTGRLPGRRWRWLAWLTVAFVLVGMLT